MTEIADRLKSAMAGRYMIERELGAGGMATVCLAHDVKHDRKVALKVLRPELAAVVGAERFLAEIKTTANLQHPHILPLHDSGEVDGLVFYVMPYVEGESLRDRLNREKQLPVADAVRIATEVADALDYAHRQNVIHRDIKPENILLHDGRALVADFGIALAAANTGGQRMTETGMSLGTPSYISPEQAMGERALDARSDIYALGCVLYEMLAGEPPFTGPTAQAIVAKVLTAEPELVTTFRKTVPPQVEAAVHTAIEKLPADRFATAEDLASALSNRVYARDGAGRTATSRHGRPNRPALLLGGVAAVAVAVAIWALLIASPRPERDVIRFQMNIPSPRAENLIAPRLALSPDGRTVAYSAAQERAPYVLHARRLDRLEPTIIAESGLTPSFAPDGASISYVTGSGELRVASLDGGAPRTVQSGVSIEQGLDWSVDGYLYYSPEGGSKGVWRIPEIGGSPTLVVELDTLGTTPGYNAPRFVDALPRGSGVLVTFYRGPGALPDVAAVDLASGRITYLVKGSSGRYAAGFLFFVSANGMLMAAPFDERRLVLTGPARSVGIIVEQEEDAAAAFAVSRTGTLVYAPPAGGRSLLAWVDRDGTEQIVDADLWRDITGVSLSPDGSRIAVSLNDEGQAAIWTYDLTQKTFSRLTFDGNLVFRPLWSPDGTQIAYSSDRTSSDRVRSLWIQPADGSGEPQLLVGSDRHVQELTWSADGRAIAYREGYSDGKTMRDIVVLRAADDTTRQPFLATNADELNPKLSPDGRWLAYTSDESGTYQVYVRPFPEGPGRWQISTGGGSEPLWRRDGRELFFRDRESNMVAVPVQAGSGFATGAPRVLFSASRYYSDFGATSCDITPDGERFLMIKRPVNETLVMVVNWIGELRAP